MFTYSYIRTRITFDLDVEMSSAPQLVVRLNWFQRALIKEKETKHRVIPNNIMVPYYLSITVGSGQLQEIF